MFGEVVDRVEQAGDDALLGQLAELEERARADAAQRSVLLAELERRGVYRRDDHASTFGLLRSLLSWSDTDCRVGMRLARFVDDHPEIGEALFDGAVSIANADELARAVTRVTAAAGDDELSVLTERELGALTPCGTSRTPRGPHRRA